MESASSTRAGALLGRGLGGLPRVRRRLIAANY